MPTRQLGVFWFKNRNQYDSYKAILTDAWVLPDDYRDWLTRFNQMVERYENSGIQVIKVECESNTFVSWCFDNGRDASTKSCNDYAVFESGSNTLRDRERDWGYE